MNKQVQMFSKILLDPERKIFSSVHMMFDIFPFCTDNDLLLFFLTLNFLVTRIRSKKHARIPLSAPRILPWVDGIYIGSSNSHGWGIVIYMHPIQLEPIIPGELDLFFFSLREIN